MNIILEMRKDLAGLVIIIVLFMMDYLHIDDQVLKLTLISGLGSLFGFSALQTAIPAMSNGKIAVAQAQAAVAAASTPNSVTVSSSGATQITAPVVNVSGDLSPQK